MKNNKISIIVPIFNSEKYLRNAIISVLNQTYINWELLLIDDESSDDSLSISEYYSNIDKRIKCIKLFHSGIPGVVRNRGIEEATGDFLFFLDSDDYLDKNTLEDLYYNFCNIKVDLVICNFRKVQNDVVIERNDNIINEDKFFNYEAIRSYALSVLDQQNKNTLFNFCWGKLYCTDIIKKNNILFNTKLYTFEDIEFNFNYLKYVNTLFYTKDTLYNYRIHQNFESVTFNTDFNKFFNFITSLELIKPFFKSFVSESVLDQKIGNAIVSMTIIQLIRSNIKISNKEISQFYDMVLQNKILRKNLKFYTPSKGESIFIPFLISLKLKKILILLIKYKAKKRYK